ncbi:MFS transporter [Allorhizobium sp. BGMRC 0089]|uniref:MFS transporter n=1 Tax=Allorhizobium sonneratiae TaxID=2934936 RepID=UPI0020341E8D|nr:MFS transporter [Allorhizobium sonneratiae]MCM2294016.1 MFS transporter [Allorhizobium sonneratiae]
MTRLNSFKGHVGLSLCHMTGMIDMAALPLWIGALMQYYGLAAPEAGLIVTTFLVGVIVASALLAPRFNRLQRRIVACGGFILSALAFFMASRLAVSPESFAGLLILHGIAGFGTGSALSVTHGSIGRTENPHRLFGIVNIALGVLAIVMFAVLPGMITAHGGQTMFEAFSLVMSVGALSALLLFPQIAEKKAEKTSALPATPFPRAAWLTIGIVICLTLNQSMIFSFVERIGDIRGFGADRVQTVLIVLGFINLLPGLLAAILQKHLSPIAVGIAGPLLQAAFAMSLTNTTSFAFYAVPTAFYVSLVIFTHTFLFGLMAKIDPSGRAVAATPAMMMTGSATGPALGGIIVATVGYGGLGFAVMCVSAIAVCLMLLVRKKLSSAPLQPVLAIPTTS